MVKLLFPPLTTTTNATRRRRVLLLAAVAFLLLLATPWLPTQRAWGAEPTSLKEVRYWSSVDVTRVAIETSQDVEFTHKQLSNPPRVFVDLVNVRPHPSFKGIAYTIPVDDGLVQKIRVAPNQTLVTRVVLDLDEAAEISIGKLVNPTRIILDVRRAAGAAPAAAKSDEGRQQQPEPASSASSPTTTSTTTPIKPAPLPPLRQQPLDAADQAKPLPPAPAIKTGSEFLAAAKVVAPLSGPASSSLTRGGAIIATPPPPASTAAAAAAAPRPAAAAASAARLPSSAPPSLTRVLGLKLNRIVLDAGHGGHDPGSSGPNGLVEKDLVLDVTLRLGRLLEEKMGADVVYTRKDDTFVRLEERAPFANHQKADLFLSIHANSSPARSVVGTETYFLNRTESREELAVAARENAMAETSIADLSSLVKKIVSNDKRDESRELAARIQAAAYEFTSATHGRVFNRGVRHAPFVVLIGATMPAVLVEIGFMSNPKEEALLKRGEHRQRLAEALYKGILNYSRTLSHFSMARTTVD